MLKTQKYTVRNMDCAECALKIEKSVAKMDGVESVNVNFMGGNMQVTGDVSKEELTQKVESLGYGLSDTPQAYLPPQESFLSGFLRFVLRETETRLALAGGALILLSVILGRLGVDQQITRIILIVALALAGYSIAKESLLNLVRNRAFDIGLLMTLAAIGAIFLGDYVEAATLIFLFSISEALEAFSADRARGSIRNLQELAPPTALRLTNGVSESVALADLAIGDRLLIKPGERVPMDGIIVKGESQLNQAAITGESMPQEKAVGDEVYAGTINGNGALEVTVSRLSEDSTLNRIITMVEEAQATRAPAQRMIDKFAGYYTPAMIVLAILVATIPPLFFNQPFLEQDGVHGWLYRGLNMLVISCPCALVVSTPVTIVTTIAAAAKRGILIKGGAFIEALASVDTVAFDKTGTLTKGQPELAHIATSDCAHGLESNCEDCDDMLAVAASLESQSTHPLAHAVVDAAKKRAVHNMYPPAEELRVIEGKGLAGKVNGIPTLVGSHRYFEESHPHSEELCQQVSSAEESGETTMLVATEDKVRGFLSVIDAEREESRDVLAQLRKMGKRTVLLTGDNAATASNIARSLGVAEVKSELLPQDKVTAVRELMGGGHKVAMIGDGINDAPALAASTVGIAVGGKASAQAMDTADIVLMSEGLKSLPLLFKLSNFAKRLIIQNITIALGVKLIFIVLALMGYTSMWMAVLADSGLSLLVTANGMRPLAVKD